MNQSLKFPNSQAGSESGTGHASTGALAPRTLDPYRFLRRRYVLCAVLILAGAAGGMWTGKQMVQPRYRSTGLVRIAPVLPRVLSDAGDAVPAIDAYMKSQVALIQSQQLCELAVHDPRWQTLGRGDADKDVKRLMDSLEVQHIAPNETIKVSCTDANPDVAMVGVQSVISAYTRLSASHDTTSSTKRLAVLQERATALAGEGKAIQDQIGAIAQKYGADDLAPLHQYKLQELNRLDAQLKLVEESRVSAEAACTGLKSNASIQDALVHAIASVDPLMRQYVKDKSDVQRQIEEMSSTFGPNHRLMVAAKNSVAWLDKAIAQYADEYRNFVSVASLESMNGGDGVAMVLNVERLRQREQRLHQLQTQALVETTELWKQNTAIKELRQQEDTLRQRLDETQKRIEQFGLEASVSGRIEVMSSGNRPISPFRNAPLELASVGGVMGAIAVFGLIVIAGMMDKRLRTASEVRAVAPTVALLGSVPVLRRAGLTQQTAVVARRIHQIRSVLQIQSAAQNQRVFVVTSPSAGDGKTCLTLALGISFATTNTKTLLIDCDLTGQGLSARVRQLAPADSGAGLGLVDAMIGQPLEKCVVQTEIPSLFVLPLGAAGGRNIGQLSIESLERLINKARTMFETILIDTGPIAASPEASPAAAAADAVVLAISRGDDQAAVQQAMEQLRSVNARVAGIVYNRATPADLKASGSSSSRYAWHHRPVVRTSAPLEKWLPLGPLALAVASYASMEPAGQATVPVRKAG